MRGVEGARVTMGVRAVNERAVEEEIRSEGDDDRSEGSSGRVMTSTKE